jgi:hypothetical protein
MIEIQLYNRDLKPEELLEQVTYDSSQHFEELLSISDQQEIDKIWEERKRNQWDNSLGNLWDTSQGQIVYTETNFRYYDTLGFTNNWENKPFNFQLYEYSRASSVGVVLETGDEIVIIQRRKAGLLAGGKLDPSVAGICVIKEGKLDLQRTALERILQELSLSPEEIYGLIPTGLHSSSDYCSSMFTFKVKTDLEFGAIKERTSGSRMITEPIPVSKDKLPQFIVKHFLKEGDLIGDGCAAFLASLEPEATEEVISSINKYQQIIKNGALVSGKFQQTS